jgi:hypothetical protein
MGEVGEAEAMSKGVGWVIISGWEREGREEGEVVVDWRDVWE